MKIIVDEMPVFRDECPFCKMDFGECICSKSDLECNIDMCDFLKPITDYVLEECVAENITKRVSLTDVGNERRSNKKDVSYDGF